MEGDVRRILLVQALRAFLYGLGAVLIGSVLAERGVSAGRAGAIFTAMLAGMGVTSLVVGRWGHHVPQRALYAGLLLVMGIAGGMFAVTSWLPLLLLAALTGTVSTDPNESGPITSLEHAMLGAVPSEQRARAFGRYNAVAYLAGSAGALAAGGPQALRQIVPSLPADQRWLFAFPIVAVAAAIVATGLSSAVEPPADGAERGLGPSRARVRRLATLFSVDSFAGGFVVQSFIVYWFGREFGASAATMGVVFFAAGLLQGGSSLLAPRIAARIGLLRTAVFTHLPSNVLLIAVPFAPNLPVAIALLLARSALSQMDVPARQAYVVSVVEPAERTAAAAYTNTARYLTRPVAPSIGGALMQAVARGAPFVAAGTLKIAYDLALYAMFKDVDVD